MMLLTEIKCTRTDISTATFLSMFTNIFMISTKNAFTNVFSKFLSHHCYYYHYRHCC